MQKHAIIFLLASVLLAGPGFAQTGGATPEDELRAATAAKGAERRGALRAFIAKHKSGQLVSTAHLLLVRSLVEAKAPADETLAAARAAIDAMPIADANVLPYRVEVAVLTASAHPERKEGADLVRTVLDALPPGRRTREARGKLQVFLAELQTKQGDRDGAIATLEKAVAAEPDDQAALRALAAELEAAGRADEAVDAYVRAETVFGGEKVDGAPLRALYAKRHGSLDGLEARLAEARAASTRRVALEARSATGAAPEWELTDLSGTPVKLSSLRGHVVVLDFWATWCPPCREELPILEEIHRGYAGKLVKILAVNAEGIEDRKAWDAAVRGFVQTTKVSLPVVFDYEGSVSDAYNVTSLPTIVVVDKEGAIRYRNVGFNSKIRGILEAQVESLLN
jgi:thiol-disulfide isomerase/thioredoxin